MNLNKKILLVTNKLEKNPTGGREMLSKLNYLTLKEIFKKNFFSHEIKKKKLIKFWMQSLPWEEILMGLMIVKSKKLIIALKQIK
tara:strand:- start:4 stop:258 length:255 start_codon:yes stop_codon:yes gene_type:complete